MTSFEDFEFAQYFPGTDATEAYAKAPVALTPSPTAISPAAVGSAAGFVGQAVDTLTPTDKWGKRSVVSSGLAGAANGAAAGMAFGPIGAGVGAVVGGLTSVFGQSKINRQAKLAESQQAFDYNNAEDTRASARYAADPTLSTGKLSASYYAAGGSLPGGTQPGGSLKPLSNDTVEVKGPSHANGGVELPTQGAEVEVGETIKDDYVFSKQLGFADLHKPIARAIGKIEQKPLSPERVNALKLLQQQENNLKLSQEYVRSKLGVN